MRSMAAAVPVVRRFGLMDRESADLFQAWALDKLGRYKDALEVLTAGVQASPSSKRLVRSLGEIHYRLGRHDEADQCWQRAIALDPSDQQSWLGHAAMLQALRRGAAIEKLIERRLASDGNRCERFIDAVEIARRFSPTAFERLTSAGRAGISFDAKSLRRLAKIHAKAGDLGIALNCLDEASDLGREPKRYGVLRHRLVARLDKVGVDGRSLDRERRAAVRLPDQAVISLINRAHPEPLKSRSGISMVVTSLGPGGAERQLANTVNGLRQANLAQDITIVQLHNRDLDVDGFYRSQLADPPVPITTMADRTIEMSRLQATAGPHLRDLMPILSSSLRSHIARFATEFSYSLPQVVHCWSDRRNLTAGIAAVIMGVPRVVLGTRSISPVGNRTVPRYFQQVYHALLQCKNVRMINNSRAGAETYASWLEVDRDTIGVVYNGIDVARLDACRDAAKTEQNRRRLNLPEGARIVGSAIRFTSEKRPELWLEAAAALARQDPDAHFVLIGDGIGRPRAEAYARDLGVADRVHFIGLTKDIVPWYDLMDVVLMTSSREGTSNTALEAQALGRPIVTTAVGGMPEALLPDVTGLLAAAHPSPDELASHLRRALDDVAWRQSVKTAGPAFIQDRFSIERMANDTFALYDLDPGWAEARQEQRSEVRFIPGAASTAGA